MRKITLIALFPLLSFSQDSTKVSKQDLREIRARIIACDSLDVFMFNCDKSNKHLTNALKIKEEQFDILSGENKHLYVQNDKLKQAIDKEKRKKNWIAGALGTGIGAAVIITVVSFLRK